MTPFWVPLSPSPNAACTFQCTALSTLLYMMPFNFLLSPADSIYYPSFSVVIRSKAVPLPPSPLWCSLSFLSAYAIGIDQIGYWLLYPLQVNLGYYGNSVTLLVDFVVPT